MNIGSKYKNTNFQYPFNFRPHDNLRFASKNPFRIVEFRVYRRRRLKLNRKLALRNQLVPFDNLFNSFVSQFPSANSLEFIAPVLGFASGIALYLSRINSPKLSEVSDIGEWILFTSPTPFNRFVLLRCRSISFEGRELLEDVNEKLVKEEKHYVRLNSGRIQVKAGGVETDSDLEEKLEYQRVCVNTDDGGVISLDWPAHLDLEEEHGLDTTLLLVPGSAEGSMDRNVRSFVCEALKRGLFPVLMNPRGCAGSPLTTARLFTAADSDDVCTAIQFISKARPWTTLMGVGWGYGANMLTKYLAEVGEKTPLTAATCIDSPFDLEEATRFYSHHRAIDQKLTDGLIDILRSNKALFQGRAKGFDVEKALSAKSVRDFEKAISMVSHGFEAVEDFYSKSSTRSMVGNVKIPVLFIQNDDGSVPLFSIPRSLIAENPFTSLLLCSFLPSNDIYGGGSAISWYQQLTIEWLTAVELGLLKGRHPLLKDVDITINPPKGLALANGRPSQDSGKVAKLLDLTHLSALNGYSGDRMNDMLEESDDATSLSLRSRKVSQRKLEVEDAKLQEVENGGNSIDAELVNDEEVSPEDSERGQVLQTAQVVMNMLDITMPGILTEEKKKKVLTGIDQGETLMKALQDAVPEDVRDKLTNAVSGILHAQGTNLKINELLDVARISNVSSGLKSKIQEKVRGISNEEGSSQDHHTSDQMKTADDLSDNSVNNQPSINKASGAVESELHQSEKSQKPINISQSQSVSNQGSESSSSVRKESGDLGNNENGGENIDNIEKGSGVKPNSSSHAEKVGGAEEAIVDEHKDQSGRMAQSDTKEENNDKNEEKSVHNENKMASTSMTDEVSSSPGSFSEAQVQPTEREDNENQKMDDKNMQPTLDQTKTNSDSNSPTFNVSQAFDALTGMDDSTQVAVNSVFGVIENMITQLEEGSENESENKDEEIDSASDSVSRSHHLISDHTLEDSEGTSIDQSVEADRLSKPLAFKHIENSINSQHASPNRFLEKKPSHSPSSFNGKELNSSQKSYKDNSNRKNNKLAGSNLLLDNSYRLNKATNVPLYITSNANGGSLYNERLHNYVTSDNPTKPLDLDTTTALFLDYFPEEGKWILKEQPGNIESSANDVPTQRDVDRNMSKQSPPKVADEVIEPSYVVLDTETQQEPVEEYESTDNGKEYVEINDNRSEELMHFVKSVVLDSLKVEVGRRQSTAGMKEMEPNLARDMEQVANAVSLSIRHDKDHIQLSDVKCHKIDCTEKICTLDGEDIIRAISSAVQETSYLRRAIPVGVIIGSSLAALRKYFNVETVHSQNVDEAKKSGEIDPGMVNYIETHQIPVEKPMQNGWLDSSVSRAGGKTESRNLKNETMMMGAVTAALGASAFLVQNQDTFKDSELNSSKSLKMRDNNQKEPEKLEEDTSEKGQNNLVTSLAEKAMSVAGPVVPTKEDGEVDQERLVAMLADLGQKGGILRLVGKVALLWGGLRGAMSLTDRLIVFLRLAERPLIQRILGFISLVLVLWSPVAVPLLPAIVQSWTTKTPSRIAEFACIIGLYTAVMILVVLWGKRIRGYENPLEQYGLDLTSLPKIHNFLKGVIGGVMIVSSIQCINALLGYVSLSLPYTTSPLDALSWLKMSGKICMVVGQGIITATGVALVEELLFRSWLPQEIASDLGYHKGLIISGLAFALLQRSPWAIPGLWLLSLSLAGARQTTEGSLAVPVGMRAGILASSSILQRGGFLNYKPNLPLWITGTHPFQPFSGVIGFAFSLLLALFLYPRQPLQKKVKTTGHE
uniref:uncharacterized protein LOC107406661 isoform X1 n=2 Tax=Ziziphus jujuba TaxID=326968 RepID=A0A6P3Z3C9_ZIZJJ